MINSLWISPPRKSVRARQDLHSVDWAVFNSSSNQNYVGTKVWCTMFLNEPDDKTYYSTMYVRPAKTQVSLCIDPLYKASFLDSPESKESCILYDQRRIWSECDVTVTLFIPLWAARLSKVNTISECSDLNVQLRRLTRVFARRTRRFVKPIDCKRYIRLAKALIRLLICRLRVCRLIRLFVQVLGFTVHRPMRDLFLQTITLNILGKVFNRHFEIFLSFFQENRIWISCKLSPLHEMSNPVFLVIKQITIFFWFFLFYFFFRLQN